METLRTNTMLWVWEECLGFSKIQPDLNLSIVFCILTLSGALLRRCSNFWPVVDTCILPTLHQTGVWTFFVYQKTKISKKEVDRLYLQKQDFDCVIMARRCLFSCSLGCSRKENFLVPCSLVQWLFIQWLWSYTCMCTSHFMLSSDVMWALPNTWICAQTHPRQMQYLKR